MFNLAVDQREEFGHPLARQGGARLEGNSGHQIEEALLTLGWSKENLLVEPLDLSEVEAGDPVGKETAEELVEELLQQNLEPLVVVVVNGSFMANSVKGRNGARSFRFLLGTRITATVIQKSWF